MKKFIIILIYLLLTNTAFADFKSKSIPSNLLTLIKSYEQKQKTLPGGAIAILHQDRVIYKNIFGNRRNKRGTITSKTLFPLASVSKPITAIAIGLIVEDKKLQFKDKFKLPYLQHIVTLENLLSHTTGYKFSGNGYIEQGISRKQLLKILKEQQPKCLPKQCYRYSNTTFSLIAEAMKTKNLSFNSLIDKLKTKLHTNDIQIVPIDHSMNVAYPHIKQTVKGKTLFKTLPFPPYYPKTVPTSAGVFASLDAMIEFAKLSFGYRPRIISQKTLKSIYTPIITNKDIYKWNIKFPCSKNKIESYYALGWRIFKIKDSPNKELIFHGGHLNGVRTFIGFIPSKEISIIILTNQDSAFPGEYGFNIWAKLLDIK